MAKRIDENTILFVLGALLMWIIVNYNMQLGIIFLFMLVLTFLFHTSDKNVSFPFDRDGKWARATMIALGAYIVFIIVSTIIIQLVPIDLQSTVVSPQGVIDLVAITIPEIDFTNIMLFVGWAIIIPITESWFFFGPVVERILDTKRVHWLLAGISIATIFMLFHLTAKSVIDNSALLVTFIFGMISYLLVIMTKDLKSAVLFHVISNSVAILSTMGLLSTFL